MALSTTDKLGQAHRFRVVIDGLDLGGFQKCDGLGLEIKVKKYNEGGVNTYQPILVERVNYKDVKLTRAVTKDGNARTMAYLGRMATQFKPGTAAVQLLDAHGAVVATWSLRRVYPVAYSAPSFDAMSSKVATETLTLAHEGFLAV